MSELKPCPFCGGEACTFHIPENTKEERKMHPRWNWANEGMWVVGCLSEMCMGNINNYAMIFVTEDRAVEAWNTRKGA